MARGKSLIVSFKSNHQHQGMLLPPDLSELVGQNHPVRVVSDVLDKVNIGQLIQQYKPGGASNYHPRMLLKVLVFAYINNIYSSRKIEEALHQNINFMWLSGMSKPGIPGEGIIDRSGASSRRRENTKNVKTEQGKDRDGFPPAVLKPNGGLV